MIRAAILLLAVAMAGCVSMPDPRAVEAELRAYGGPGAVELGALLAVGAVAPYALTPVFRMRQNAVKSRVDELNLRIAILETLYEDHCP